MKFFLGITKFRSLHSFFGTHYSILWIATIKNYWKCGRFKINFRMLTSLAFIQISKKNRLQSLTYLSLSLFEKKGEGVGQVSDLSHLCGGCVFIWPNNGMILSNTLHNNFINCFYKCFRTYAHFPMFRKLLRSKLYFDMSKYINYSLWKLDIS